MSKGRKSPRSPLLRIPQVRKILQWRKYCMEPLQPLLLHHHSLVQHLSASLHLKLKLLIEICSLIGQFWVREKLVFITFHLLNTRLYVVFLLRGIGKNSPTPCVEVARGFYSNIVHFNLDDHNIIYVLRGTTTEISLTIFVELFDLPVVDSPVYPYRGIGAPRKSTMYNLFVGPQDLKWNPKVH